MKTSTFFQALFPSIAPCLHLIFNTLHCWAFTGHKRQENDFFTFLLLLCDPIPPRGLAGTGTIHILHSFKFSRSIKHQNSQKIKQKRLLKQALVMTTNPSVSEGEKGNKLEANSETCLEWLVRFWLIF